MIYQRVVGDFIMLGGLFGVQTRTRSLKDQGPVNRTIPDRDSVPWGVNCRGHGDAWPRKLGGCECEPASLKIWTHPACSEVCLQIYLHFS